MKIFNQSQNKGLSNRKTEKIEKSFRNEVIKGSDHYLKVELEKYRNLSIKVENNTPKK